MKGFIIGLKVAIFFKFALVGILIFLLLIKNYHIISYIYFLKGKNKKQ